MSNEKVTFFWLRRDLRLHDNVGLYHALKEQDNVLPLFIFDTDILDDLEDEDDARVTFIHQTLSDIHKKLSDLGSGLLVEIGAPIEVWKKLLGSYNIEAVYTNRDHEPYALNRDKQVNELLEDNDVAFHTYKDQVIFEKDEVLKNDGKPYTVYTPYMKKWREHLTPNSFMSYPSEDNLDKLYRSGSFDLPTLKDIGFTESSINVEPANLAEDTLKEYKATRDFPAKEGTSNVSPHLRFGTISIRQLAQSAQDTNDTYLNELIWREFFMQILYHFPKVVNNSFREKYDRIEWVNDKKQFEQWCQGKTGYPIVDAGMRELNATGYMHNRVRMIVASFLCKDLLIDWRWGEAYFARKLLDHELASNNGNWQWAAGTGCDAAPYFRIFNPTTQASKFDPRSVYIKKWVPELNSPDYPKPMVDHKQARERTLAAYKKAVS